MHTTITLISLLSYIGTIASAVGGTLTAKKMKLPCFLQFVLGISTAFFGEIFLCDLILLQTSPTIFNKPLEIAIAIAACIFSIMVLRCKEPENICLPILCLLNSIGIIGSATTGYNHGTKTGVLVAFACGFVTSCGGNILATVIQIIVKKDFKLFFTILSEKKWYYLFVASISVVCGILHFTSHDTNTAIMVLTIVSIVIGFIVERNETK